jgi:exonuclease III
MRIKKSLMGLFVGMCYAASFAQIPSFDGIDRLDVATWNVEWLGSSSNGPSNEATQMTNVIKLINDTKMDILGLCEVSSASAWTELLSKCPQYAGSISTWDQTQKTGVLFKKSEFKLAYSKHILSDYSYDFASGRLPLEVGLIPLDESKYSFDTLRIWVLHLKANTGSSSQKVEAYNRRYSASMVLKSYIQKLGTDKAGLILGDWNDDFDVSILSGYATPFANWTKDTQYLVATLPLSKAKQKSTVSYIEMIDHIVALPALKSNCLEDSVLVINPSSWITSYGSTTSDHYPVFARFDVTKKFNSVKSSETTAIKVFCDENGKIYLLGIEQNKIERMEQYDLTGKLLKSETNHNGFDQFEMVQSLVVLKIYSEGIVYTFKLLK